MGYGYCQKSECAVSACRDRKLIVLIRFWASRCEWALLDFGSGGTSVRRIPIVWWERILTRCAILAPEGRSVGLIPMTVWPSLLVTTA